MKYPYFNKTALDEAFFEQNLKPRLPGRIFDVHTHVNRPEDVADVPESRIMDDWAFQCGYVMTAEDAQDYFKTLFPDVKYEINAFPFPIREADIESGNAYIASCVREKKIRSGFACIKPEYGVEYLEELFETYPFTGVKPYPDMVSGKKGAEVGIFEFMTHEQFALAERYRKVVMMHLPRAGRMPDDRNIADLKEIRQKYPDLKLCIAHFGRCFTPYHFEQALEKMGSDARWLYFDTAAVSNPEVYRIAFRELDPGHILFGTDEPIFLWHGKRTWTKTAYHNLAREDFPWNGHGEGKDAEVKYTFYVYEQVNHLLNAAEEAGFGQTELENLFGGNAARLLGVAD